MTKTAFSAVLLGLGALLFHEPAQAAQGARVAPAFRAPALRPAPFRAPAPRAFHPPAGPQAHARPPQRHRFPHHRFFPVLAGSLVPIFGGAPLSYSEEPADEAPSGPVLVREGATVGCAMEDVTVPGNGGKAVVTIIRC